MIRSMTPLIQGAFVSISCLLFSGIAHAESVAIDRPARNGEPTVVNTFFYFLDVSAIDGADQSFTANLFLLCQWFDPRLAHDSDGPIELSLESVWNPRLLIVNEQKVWKSFPEVVEVTPDGQVTYRQRFWGAFSQPLRLPDFPFDRQEFHVQLAAVGYPPDEVEFRDHEGFEGGIASGLSLADWEILGWRTLRSPYVVMPGTPGVAAFKFIFEARRYPGYFVSKVILPLVLIVAMSWVVFWIEPEQATRISVSVTAMLTLIAYRFAVGSFLPRVSYLTRMDWFVLGSTVLVFATLIEVVFTSRLAGNDRRNSAIAINRWARWGFPVVFVVMTCWSFFF